jgi:Fe-S-cluster containining protein
MTITELDKPAGMWCPHCPTRTACDIYPQRPNGCREFLCGYLTLAKLGEEWKPSKSKIVISSEQGGNRICAVVDPSRPDAWRKEPFYSTLKAWAKAAIPHHGQVVVYISGRATMIFPDREVDLGMVHPDQRIITSESRSAFGIHLDAHLIHKDDPRLNNLAPQSWNLAQKAGSNQAAI